MNTVLAVALPLLLLYGLFWWWWGGKTRPLSPQEIEDGLQTLADTQKKARSHAPHLIAASTDDAAQAQREALDHEALEEVRTLLRNDDGRAFVMQNLVRYRSRALYPPGYTYGDDPREADKRYGRAILGTLLRHACVILLVARRSGSFISPAGADAWHYVALVRYRSRRDFLRFAIASSQADNFVHKWAAIEKTHVFPVQPILSLFAVRTLVALSLWALGTALLASLGAAA